MDLALAFGSTVDELEERLTVAEWNLWRRYAARPGLPYRRLELYLAQVAQVVGVTSEKFKPDTPLGAFLLDHPTEDESPGADPTAEELDDDDDEEGPDAFGDLPIAGVRPLQPDEE